MLSNFALNLFTFMNFDKYDIFHPPFNINLSIRACCFFCLNKVFEAKLLTKWRNTKSYPCITDLWWAYIHNWQNDCNGEDLHNVSSYINKAIMLPGFRVQRRGALFLTCVGSPTCSPVQWTKKHIREATTFLNIWGG